MRTEGRRLWQCEGGATPHTTHWCTPLSLPRLRKDAAAAVSAAPRSLRPPKLILVFYLPAATRADDTVGGFATYAPQLQRTPVPHTPSTRAPPRRDSLRTCHGARHECPSTVARIACIASHLLRYRTHPLPWRPPRQCPPARGPPPWRSCHRSQPLYGRGRYARGRRGTGWYSVTQARFCLPMRLRSVSCAGQADQ